MSVIFIHNRCNNNCVMCPHPVSFWATKRGFDLPSLLKKLNRYYCGEEEFVMEGFPNTFYISGGEPTLSSYLFIIIKKLKSLFPNFKISCLTNGRMFSYKDYAKQILELDPNLEIAIPLHGPTTKIHDRISRTPESFSQTIRGLENIFRVRTATQLIEIRIVIHGLNYRFLGKTLENFLKIIFLKLTVWFLCFLK